MTVAEHCHHHLGSRRHHPIPSSLHLSQISCYRTLNVREQSAAARNKKKHLEIKYVIKEKAYQYSNSV